MLPIMLNIYHCQRGISAPFHTQLLFPESRISLSIKFFDKNQHEDYVDTCKRLHRIKLNKEKVHYSRTCEFWIYLEKKSPLVKNKTDQAMWEYMQVSVKEIHSNIMKGTSGYWGSEYCKISSCFVSQILDRRKKKMFLWEYLVFVFIFSHLQKGICSHSGNHTFIFLWKATMSFIHKPCDFSEVS